MYAVLWIFFGLLLWLIPYFILSQQLKNIQKNQSQLLDKINLLEYQAQQSSSHPQAPPIPQNPAATKPSHSNNQTTDALTPELSPDAQHDQQDPFIKHGVRVRTAIQSAVRLEPDERSISVITSVWATLSSWFSGGNSIVRIGVLVLLIGIILLLRLLNDTINMPVEVWLSAIAIAAIGLTSLGLRLRHTRRGYALSLQGTGLAILYLTLFSAYRLYDILPSQLTFLLLAILASVTAVLSLRQDALPLAVLGFGGAFFAPILTSTEQGQVVLLFSYYLLINIAVAWVAHQRTWKMLNLLGAATTFGLASVWGWQSFDHTIRWPMELLLIAHVVLYVFIVVRYSQLLAQQPVVPQPTQLTTQPTIQAKSSIISIDSGLLFGVPLVAFGLQAGLLHDVQYALAISSAVLALLYLALAYWLKQQSLALPLLREGILALGFGFLALVLPLAFDAQWTATGWLIQGVALVWVGTRQTRFWQVVFGLGLQVISLLILGWLWLTDANQSLWLELSIGFSTLLFSAVSLRQSSQHMPLQPRLSSLLFIILSGCVGVWLLQDRWGIISAISDGNRIQTSAQIIWDLLLLSQLGLLLSMHLMWTEMRWVIRRLSLLSGALLVAVVWQNTSHHSLTQHALLLASVAWLGLQLLIWRHLTRQDSQQSQRWDQAIGLGLTLLLLSLWSFEFYPNAIAVVLLPIMILLVLASAVCRERLPKWLELQRGQQDLYPLLAFGFTVWILWANLNSSGQFWPLPYLPLLNLLDACLIAVMFWLYQNMPLPTTPQAAKSLQAGRLALGGLAFWSLSGLVVRGLHQWLETPLWPTAWHSDTVQTSLTIVWSSTALLMTMLASRQAWRSLWWIGLGLLAVVIAKLLLVDLSNLSAMARVISFIGAGGVMLIIGYVAPLPPEITSDSTQQESTKQ